ncbi:hypothetical protein MPTK1_1g22550 [Marchantia polymorpha subsp. ruderalis]|uniref:Uncharacterized protein n=2 Tax=Marchantia polymorpha TaxID=3197 RepID=A0AAF6AT58_MARPO|nr:hypothetical protein MARPO_0118s0032 [Marchantia polymorpha]BBM99628.1 hypothetical protein Mp_1g22550 [Marchantia polymorpha subsp. ruderalis]|eukprot:PTQ30897.1 hypothetical protein MARPO_0118s0032 [Marchantia polymorpha]
MITKLFNLCLHPSTSGPKALQGVDHDKFEAFYESLGSKINSLEHELGQDSHFSLAWILSAMDFVRSLHSSVFKLIEEVWLPMRKTAGMDVIETYLNVSVKLLEMCNYLRDGVSQLEYSQLSLEHCLISLGGLVETLAHTEGSDEFVAVKKQLESCRLELEKMESKTAPNLWVEMIHKSKGSGVQSGSGRKKQDEPQLSTLERSFSVLPSPSFSKKAFLISQVMQDVQLVITFVYCLLLWVLTDTSEQFSFAYDFNAPSFATWKSDLWAGSLLSLKHRIENSELKHKRSNCSLSLKEIRLVHGAVLDLIEQVEQGVQQSAQAAETNRSETLQAVLERSKTRLNDMTQLSDKLSLVANDTFSEILHSQEKIMNIVENQLLRSITI